MHYYESGAVSRILTRKDMLTYTVYMIQCTMYLYILISCVIDRGLNPTFYSEESDIFFVLLRLKCTELPCTSDNNVVA
jgi:hypothetical protein